MSMRNNQDEFEFLIQEDKYDLKGIMKTGWNGWNKGTIIEGYSLSQRNRSNKKEGGVACYLQNILLRNQINELGNVIKSIWVKISSGGKIKAILLIMSTITHPIKLQIKQGTKVIMNICWETNSTKHTKTTFSFRDRGRCKMISYP